jgi:hypothetical protein
MAELFGVRLKPSGATRVSALLQRPGRSVGHLVRIGLHWERLLRRLFRELGLQ